MWMSINTCIWRSHGQRRTGQHDVEPPLPALRPIPDQKSLFFEDVEKTRAGTDGLFTTTDFPPYIVLTQPCWPFGWMFSGQDCGQERWWQWWHLSLRYATPLTIHHNHLGRTFIAIRQRPFPLYWQISGASYHRWSETIVNMWKLWC